MQMVSVAMLCAALVALFALSANGVTVRETDGFLYNINLKINVSAANAFLPPQLKADLYNGSAWVSLMVCQIEKIEMNIAGIWIPTPMSATWIIKTYVPVYRPGTNHTGYMILSMDFENSFSGWAQALGCKSTQVGVVCLEATALTVGTNGGGNVSLAGSDGAYLNAQFASTNSLDTNFVRWLIDRDYKYEAGTNGDPTEGPQSGKDNPQNYQGAVAFNTMTFSSSILSKRFPGLASAESTSPICQSGACFASPYLQFIDNSGTPI
jgi:hypothetical protein